MLLSYRNGPCPTPLESHMLGSPAGYAKRSRTMVNKPISATNHTASDASSNELEQLIASWRRHLVAGRMSPRTIQTYTIAVSQLAAFLAAQGMPTSPASITREHVEAFITDLLARRKPATAHNRYRGCQSFFGWFSKRARFPRARWSG